MQHEKMDAIQAILAWISAWQGQENIQVERFAGLGDIYYDLATVVYTHDSDGPMPPDLEADILSTSWSKS